MNTEKRHTHGRSVKSRILSLALVAVLLTAVLPLNVLAGLVRPREYSAEMFKNSAFLPGSAGLAPEVGSIIDEILEDREPITGSAETEVNGKYVDLTDVSTLTANVYFIDSNTALIGDGDTTIEIAETLVIGKENGGNIVLQDLTIDFNGYSGSYPAIIIEGGKNIVLDNIVIKNYNGSGAIFEIESGTNIYFNNINIRFENCIYDSVISITKGGEATNIHIAGIHIAGVTGLQIGDLDLADATGLNGVHIYDLLALDPDSTDDFELTLPVRGLYLPSDFVTSLSGYMYCRFNASGTAVTYSDYYTGGVAYYFKDEYFFIDAGAGSLSKNLVNLSKVIDSLYDDGKTPYIKLLTDGTLPSLDLSDSVTSPTGRTLNIVAVKRGISNNLPSKDKADVKIIDGDIKLGNCIIHNIDFSGTSITPGQANIDDKIVHCMFPGQDGDSTPDPGPSSPEIKYVLAYDVNGGSGAPSSRQYKADAVATVSSVAPTRAGYVFLGWSTSASADSAHYTGGESITMSSDVTLYAVWQELEIGFNAADWTVEVLDRRTPGAPSPTWSEAQSHLNLTVVDETGAAVSGVSYTCENYASVNFRKLGNYTLTITAALPSGDKMTTSSVIHVVDTTPPEIFITNPTITLSAPPFSLGEILARAGVKTEDNYDESVVFLTSFQDQNLAQGSFADMAWRMGEDYVMLVNATDSSQNAAVQRTVTIRLRDGGELPEGEDKVTIIPGDDGTFYIVDEDGVPLGQYVQDDDGNWIFLPDAEVPLSIAPDGELPKTGTTQAVSVLILALFLTAAGAVLLSPKKKKAE